MTPDVQAAIDAARAYLEARRTLNAILRQEDTGTVTSCRNTELRLDHLEALLAAADTAETRIEWATLQRWPSDGAEQITDPVGEWLARRRVTQYPKMHPALMHRVVSYGPWTEGEPGESGERAETGHACGHTRAVTIGGACGECTALPEIPATQPNHGSHQ